MATLEELGKELIELRRRLELAETKLSQQAGQFEFITGQLRDVQLYMHARFADMDEQFAKAGARIDRLDSKIDRLDVKVDRIEAKMDAKFAQIDAKLDALPRILAELIADKT